MTRPVWHCAITIKLINGTRGEVHVAADDCLTFREMKAQVLRALSMAEQLTAEPPVEVVPAAPGQWGPRIVNQ
jgi:hypothetical protein